MKIEKYYDAENAASYEVNRKGSLWLSEDDAFIEFYNTITDEFISVPDGESKSIRVLDLPVGTGRWIPFLNNNIKSYTGVDVSTYMIEEAKKKIIGHDKFSANFINQEWQEYLPNLKGEFELIISTRFFAHFNESDVEKMIKMFSGSTNRYLITQVRACDNYFKYYLEITLSIIKNPARIFKRWMKSGRLTTSHPRSVYLNSLDKANLKIVKSILLQKSTLSSFEYWLVEKR